MWQKESHQEWQCTPGPGLSLWRINKIIVNQPPFKFNNEEAVMMNINWIFLHKGNHNNPDTQISKFVPLGNSKRHLLNYVFIHGYS